MDKDSHAQHPQEDQPAAAHETLEELRTRHKKEKRELTAKVTALKKIAKNDKKKKKEVTEEIAQLEHAQNVQHDKEEKEWKSLYGTSTPAENHIPDSTSTSSAPSQEPQEDEEDDFDVNDIPIDHLIIEPTPAKQQQQQQAPGGKKPNRQRARKDRKAQAIKEIQDQAQKEASGKVNMNEVERKAIEELAQAMSVSIQDITADGHCLYNAISDQLVQHYNVEASVKELRRDTAEHMRSNPDDFMPFLTNKQGDIMSPEDFAEYCQDLESTAVWGGQPELLALSRVHKVPIWVVQMGSPTVKLSSDAYPTKTPLKVSYHRHMYGLGEHYNSLRPKQASV